MNASKELFWNIQFGSVVYVLGIILVGIVAYVLYRRYRVWRLGQPDNRLHDIPKRIWSFVIFSIVDGLAHRRILRQPYSGIMHFLIFGGMGILLIGTFLHPLSHYFFHFLHGEVYLWTSLILDVAGLLILIGLIMAFFRRYIQKLDRLDNTIDDALILLIIFLIVVSGFVLEAARIAQTELQTNPEWAVWSPVGFVIAKGMIGLGDSVLLALHRAVWWIHLAIFFGGVIYVGVTFSKLSHIVVAPLSALFRSFRPKGVPVPIDIMNAESFGASKIQDLASKHLLDLDACVRCGRCQNNCPAYLTGKPLSPKRLTQNLKAHLLETASHSIVGKLGETAKADNGNRSLIGDVVTEEELWACTMCGACEEVCPIFVEHTDKILAMRRNLALERAELPSTAQASLVNTQQRGHPWKGTTCSRTDWFSDIEVVPVSESDDSSFLLWVGCTGALVERNMQVTAALAKLLTKAGIKFSVLGDEESCCGHFARRLGDEYLFQVQAEKNIETLKNYNVKKIITICPHCYHTLKNEYPQFGGKYQVFHHTEIIHDLLKKGKLELNTKIDKVVTYQDPCYLGRYSNIYKPPLKIIKAIPDIKLVQMSHHGSNGLCCGAGGGHMWIEELPDQRVNQLRIKEAIQVKADIITTACPFCLQMFDDAIKTLEKEDSMKVMDLTELVEASSKPSLDGIVTAPQAEETKEEELATAGKGIHSSSG